MTVKSLVLMICLLTLTACPAPAQQADQAEPAAGAESPIRKDSYHYVSDDGDFQVTWPAGCGKLRIRANEPEFFVEEEVSQTTLIYLVVCDREGRQGEGCSVKATFDAPGANGGDAGPDQVTARVQRALETFGVKMVKQIPIKREFADGLVVEGVDVLGTMQSGEGEFWVRGLLSYHDIYILTAWSVHGGVWDNPEYQEFFSGFIPYAE